MGRSIARPVGPADRECTGASVGQHEKAARRLDPDLAEAGCPERGVELGRVTVDLDDRELAAVGNSPCRPIADDGRMVIGARLRIRQ
jgi:hypothetical protein